jgi:Leucine-rich repeat (LRR) protein
MDSKKFDKFVSNYRAAILKFKISYPFKKLLGKPIIYPYLHDFLPHSTINNEHNFTEEQFAWICQNLTIYSIVFFDKLFDYSLLRKQTQLRELIISRGQITDIDFLRHASQLRSLRISNNSIVDWTGLKYLTQLETLDITATHCQNIDFLAYLPNLRSLKMGENAVANIAALSNCPHLVYLELYKNGITDITPLAALIKLNWINLSVNTIKDLSPLQTLQNLEVLMLYNCNLHDDNLIPLLPKLKQLGISGNFLTRLPALPPTLTMIHCDHNYIDDLQPLSKLPLLQVADFAYNNPIRTVPSPDLYRFTVYDGYYNLPKVSADIPPEAQAIWTLLRTQSYENIELAEALAQGLGWDKNIFLIYKNFASEIVFPTNEED